MDETRFRALMRDAIGDEAMHPRLAAAVRTRLAEQPARAAGIRLPLLVAAVVLVAVTATAWFMTPFLTSRTMQNTFPAASPSPGAVVDPSHCRLPVVAQQGQYGFIDTQTGKFTRDKSEVIGEPHHQLPAAPSAYTPELNRWLSVAPRQVSPDGRSYAWSRDLPAELHRFDIATGEDTTLLTFIRPVYIWRWDLEGIRVGDQPFDPMRSGSTTTWLVDPNTGEASQSATLVTGPFTPLPGDPHGTDGSGFHPLGTDAQGHVIWWFFNLDKPGAVDWVFYETDPGQRVYIFKGTQGDATGFDPGEALGDGTGVWFTDHDHAVIWHWQPGGELRRVAVTGLPDSTSLALAGPCF